ncbi:MAG: hypothetical protein AB8B70_04435 [Prochlorococcus sp.]
MPILTRIIQGLVAGAIPAAIGGFMGGKIGEECTKLGKGIKEARSNPHQVLSSSVE